MNGDRRAFLRAALSVVTAGLAGCSLGDSTEPGETSARTATATSESDSRTAEPTATLTPAATPADTQTATERTVTPAESPETPSSTETSTPAATPTPSPTPVPIDIERRAKVAAADGDVRDGFGSAVAIDGDTILVGAIRDDDPNGPSENSAQGEGSAYVFVRSGGTWRQQAKLAAEDGENGDDFGELVDLVGDTAIVTASNESTDRGQYSGAAYVFQRSGDNWSRHARIGVGGESAQFGSAVSLTGERALVGAVGAGLAHVYSRSGATWNQEAALSPPADSPVDTFGAPVALRDETAVVVAGDDDDPDGGSAGAAFVFERTGGEWSRQAVLRPVDDEQFDALALTDDRVILGAEEADPSAYNAGRAAVFARGADGAWHREATLTAADGDEGDQFGSAVAIEGETALVGARHDEDPNGTDAGAVYVFTGAGGDWNQRRKLVPGDGDAADAFGDEVALDDGTAVVGARGDEDPNGYWAGSAYVFEL